MEETGMTGANKLVERILADARADAERVRTESERQLGSARAERARKLGEMEAAAKRQRESAVAAVLDGSRTRAALDGRKAALAQKRAVIEAAFARAYEAMGALKPEERAEILERVLLTEAEGGETVVPAKADRKALTALAAASKRNLTVSERDAAFDGGFLLVGEGFEKDCSFRAILKEVRGAEETQVASLLFH